MLTDYGLFVRWYTKLVEGPSDEPLDVADVRDNHLRSPNGSAEDAYIATLIASARRMAERITRRALISQRWQLIGSGFPVWYPGLTNCISVPNPPLVAVTSLTYIDSDGNQQALAEGTDYLVSAPSGPTAGRAEITPAFGKTWPVARCQSDAVMVSFTAGYPEDQIPEDILHGMKLVIGEFYKQRSESVHAPNQNPALIRARDLWLPYRVY